MPFAFLYFDPYYLLFVGPTMLIALWASWRVKSTFLHFSNVGVRSGMTGAQAAAAVARAGGAEVTIERHPGFLSDHYDPTSKTLRLSPDVYDGRSVASIAVAAHEAGHAIQDAHAYAWLGFRSLMVPVTKFGSSAWIWVFIAGGILSSINGGHTVGLMLSNAAIVLFGIVVLFQTGIVSTQEESDGVRKVLGAAAMTYVASALTAIATLLYLLMRRRD
jgi:uncharacterized protein